MALTSAQIVAVRRYLGYSVYGSATDAGYRELVYSDVSMAGLSIETRLANLTSDEETVITTYYLPNLQQREQEIQDASSNLDTDSAAVWTHNKQEVADRTGLFRQLRLDLCNFLGFSPGRGLQTGTRLMRS